ncbi:MAG: NupC/NupG family nucleoside CNT transporter [Gemmatimonadales bacterium]
MSARRTLVACGVALACALAVFALPGLAWSSVRSVAGFEVAQDTVAAVPALVPPQDTAVSQATPAAQPITTPAPLPPRPLGTRLRGLLGLAALLGIAVALSSNRRRISWRVLAWGLGLQAAFAVFVLRVPVGQRIFRAVGAAVTWLLHFSYEGSKFVFGELGSPNSKLGVIFAFQVLPAIIFVSALFAIMYYLGVMQLVVRAFAVVMNRVMGASGAESLNVAASIFMGQTEAPLTIRPFLPRMTRSELMTVMTAGMAHVSGSIMAAYIAFGIEARHLLTAVIMTAPGTIMMAKILEPETDTPETLGGVKVDVPRTDVNVLDAAARGTGEGLQLMLNVMAMLVSVIALVALLNGVLGVLHAQVSWVPASLQAILGFLFWPIAWLMGVPTQDTGTIASLLGTRMVLNEFIAFAELGTLRTALDPVSVTIATFALCGFANLSSIGIQIGGIGALAPERKPDLARLGLRAMIAGTLANFVSATLAAMLL